MEQESDIRVQATSPGITSISVMRSAAVTAYAAPDQLLMCCCSVRSVRLNGSGFRHTIVSVIAQLLDSVGHFRNVPSIGCDAVTHPCNGNHSANLKMLKVDDLIDGGIYETS
jgi:hypothetical protein